MGRKLLTWLAFFVAISFFNSAFFHFNRLCVNGRSLPSRVCSNAGILDDDDPSNTTVSIRSLRHLLEQGINCHELEAFWDADGVFYVGHPQVLQKNFNLSVDAVAALSTAEFAEAVRRDNAIHGVPLKLSELMQVSSKHRISPISLKLQGSHLPDYPRRLLQLHSQVPARAFVLSLASVEEAEKLSGGQDVALTFHNTTDFATIPAVIQRVPQAIVAASWRLWDRPEFVAAMQAGPRSLEGSRYRPLLARDVDHRDYFRFRDMLTSPAIPDFLVTATPLALSRRLMKECEVNPASDDLRNRVEHRFFLTWSNALPWATIYD